MRAVLQTLADAEPTDLRHTQLKFTYVGPQHKPLPSLVLATFQQLPSIESFADLKHPGLNYSNDLDAWWISTTPHEMHSIVIGLAGLETSGRPPALQVVSVSAVVTRSRLGALAFEVILDRPSTAAVFGVVRENVDPNNGLAHHVLDLWGIAVLGEDASTVKRSSQRRVASHRS